MNTEVKGFAGPYRFLSNFWPCTIHYDGHAYRTVEHAYQAAKTLMPDEREVVRGCITAAGAKRAGKKVTMRPDWEHRKLEFMEEFVRQKFTRRTDLRDLLLGTGDVVLEEANTHGDRFWGTCYGVGHNHLGLILMKVREELAS